MENVVFRKALRGYNKEDVNAYIIKVSRLVAEAESAKQEALVKLDVAEKEKEALSAELAALKASCAEQASKAASEVETKLEELKKELEETKEALESCKKQAQAGEEKTRQYDTLSGKIGEVMINANAQAQALISDAERRATEKYHTMLDESKVKIDELNEKYSGKLFDKTRELLKRLDDIVTDSALLKAEVKVALDDDIEECKKSDGDKTENEQ